MKKKKREKTKTTNKKKNPEVSKYQYFAAFSLFSYTRLLCVNSYFSLSLNKIPDHVRI